MLRFSLAHRRFKVKPAESGTLAPSRRQPGPKKPELWCLGEPSSLISILTTAPEGIGHQRPLQLSTRLIRSTFGKRSMPCATERGRFFVRLLPFVTSDLDSFDHQPQPRLALVFVFVDSIWVTRTNVL
jgi:hypothetical protein